ncbi:MAG: hypothetical protein ND895_15005 [Pyrinomonadaceae bacterium]|nr:hypothetical protein [Pyrinomonadaceae bacterium]
MKITKFMALAIAVLITVLLSSSAQAQKGAFVSFKGIEVSTGHEETGEAYGWMCYAKTTGTLPGNLTLSMNYEGTKAPGTFSTVTGGAWTLPVYEQSALSTMRPIRIDPYLGVLFGSVEAGAVTWDKAGTTATVELKLLIRGGTQALADVGGTAVLYGTVNYGEKGTATFDGTIYFDFK